MKENRLNEALRWKRQAKECEKLDKDFNLLRKEISTLDKYYIPTRYQNGLPGGIPAEVFKKEIVLKQFLLQRKH